MVFPFFAILCLHQPSSVSPHSLLPFRCLLLSISHPFLIPLFCSFTPHSYFTDETVEETLARQDKRNKYLSDLKHFNRMTDRSMHANSLHTFHLTSFCISHTFLFLLIPSLRYPSLPFSSLPFVTLPFFPLLYPSLPFDFLRYPSLPYPSPPFSTLR